MVKTYKPNDFNRKCQIGVTKTVTTPTGGKIEKIDPATVLNVRFAAKMRSLALQFQIIGTTTADTFDIAIRHNKLVTKKMCVQIDDVLYNIINISSDESAKAY
jgi:SPP1 family predicted phage head-tail adaptor